ncbi:MAG: response regulator [Myxococcota bacterium]
MDSPCILLVEDDDDDAALAVYALARASSCHEVLRARDGAEAVRYAVGSKVRALDLVLLDLHLPRLDGKAVLRHIRAPDLQRVPVVVLSSSVEPVDLADCYSLEANSYLRKPVDLRAFTEDLSLTLFYWLKLNVPPGEAPGRRDVRHTSEGVHAEHERARPFTLVRTLLTGRSHRDAHASGSKASALVIDRDPWTRARTVRALQEVAGSTAVMDVDTAEAAIGRLATAKADPGTSPWAAVRLVMLDLDHHTTDGPRMIREIRSVVDHRLPIVVFTRQDNPDAVAACYALGVNSVVRKADDLDYDDTVRLIGHYWLRLNETLPIGAMVPLETDAGR